MLKPLLRRFNRTYLLAAVPATLLLALVRGSCIASEPARIDSPPLADPWCSLTTRIEPGCLLYITVPQERELSGVYTVDSNCSVTFEVRDEQGGNGQDWNVPLGGLTADEARSAIEMSLQKYIVSPQVQVVVARLPRIRVDISGAVLSQGDVDLLSHARLSDLLAAAGLRTGADLTGIRLFQAGSTTFTVIDFTGTAQDADPILTSGVRVDVPSRLASVIQPASGGAVPGVRVVGEVVRESSLPAGTGLNVKEALERSGGLLPDADHAAVRIVRGASGIVLEVNADHALQGDPVHNLNLSPGDVLIVRRSVDQRFAVLGEVMAPNTWIVAQDRSVTILQAIEMAGGLTRHGDAHKCVLRRHYMQDPTHPTDIPFDIDRIKSGRQPDTAVEPGDAIVVLPRQNRPTVWQELLPLVFHFLPL